MTQIHLPNYSTITNNVVNHLLNEYHLDPTERKVFVMLLSGCTDKEIADELGCTKSWSSELVYRIVHKAMNTEGVRAGFFRVILEEVDSVIQYEDVLIKQQKEKLGIQC